MNREREKKRKGSIRGHRLQFLFGHKIVSIEVPTNDTNLHESKVYFIESCLFQDLACIEGQSKRKSRSARFPLSIADFSSEILGQLGDDE